MPGLGRFMIRRQGLAAVRGDLRQGRHVFSRPDPGCLGWQQQGSSDPPSSATGYLAGAIIVSAVPSTTVALYRLLHRSLREIKYLTVLRELYSSKSSMNRLINIW
ncbi:hypothetical protein CIB48_g657 [Xylaria polymorpha]|nr:hypothetical protein CIB48_g657 [Xylaria polymorpha]